MGLLQTIIGTVAIGVIGGYAAFLIYDRIQDIKERRKKKKDKWE